MPRIEKANEEKNVINLMVGFSYSFTGILRDKILQNE